MAIDDKRQNCKRVLVLQGGGALGAYQGVVYEAVTLRGGKLDWVADITSAWIAAVSSSSRSKSNMATFSAIRPGLVVGDWATTPPCRTAIAASSGSARTRPTAMPQ
jgi:accessory colonization factor AcfC